MSKQLTEIQRVKICTLYEEGWSVRRLADKFNVNICTIRRTIKKADNFGIYKHVGNNGRSTKYSPAIMSFIIKENKQNVAQENCECAREKY